MKILKMQKRNKKSYFVTLSVSDYDIEMFEDLAWGYQCKIKTNKLISKKRKITNLQPKYGKWVLKTFKEFRKLWNKYD